MNPFEPEQSVTATVCNKSSNHSHHEAFGEKAVIIIRIHTEVTDITTTQAKAQKLNKFISPI